MGSWRLLTIAAGVALLALGAAREAGATAQDFYGDNFDENVLIPIAECGPGGIDTLFTITDPEFNTPPTSFLHIRAFDRNSVSRCDYCVPFTRGDVYAENFCRIVRDQCAPSQQEALRQPNGSFLAYITVEGAGPDSCGSTADDLDIGDAFYGNIYFTDLGNNRATGLTAPTFDPTQPVGAPVAGPPEDAGYLAEFPLVDGQVLSVRFLQGLAGNKASASTRIVVCSATSGDPANPGNGCFADAAQTVAIPDSNCLTGTAGIDEINVCDANEDCFSQGFPPLDREINVFSADDFVPAIFTTDGGFINFLPGPGFPGQLPPFNTLHVIAISDQESPTGGVRAAFYAPRD